jgi:hypothetical protein
MRSISIREGFIHSILSVYNIMRLEHAGDGIHKFKAVFNDGTSTKFGAQNYMDHIKYYHESHKRNVNCCK